MKAARVFGVSLTGTQADLVTVEARHERADKGRVEVVLSGLPDPVIRESRGRLLSALGANRLGVPAGRLYLHLSPAGLPKNGEALDLALAVGAVTACGHLTPGAAARALYLGELGVDGRLHPVPGGFAAAEAAERAGIVTLIAPRSTAEEAAAHPGVTSLVAERLSDVVAWIAGGSELEALAAPSDGGDLEDERRRAARAALGAIRGQVAGKRALAVAAVGGHALLFHGPPGTGKSLLARALVHLLPAPDFHERVEITRVLSAAGRWPGALARNRPFRAPHHTASYAGLVGGGNPPRPGEITLAHRGVLFLDELTEWRRETLECLRQPLESGAIGLARAGRRLELPAAFQLVAAMNPCPCGFRGHPQRACRCGPGEVRRYWRRLSGPLVDRLALRLELLAPKPESVADVAPGEPAVGALVGAIDAAVERRRARQGARANAALDATELTRWAPLAARPRALLFEAAERRALSVRAVHGVWRVARSLADLAGVERVAETHVGEALALHAPLDDP